MNFSRFYLSASRSKTRSRLGGLLLKSDQPFIGQVIDRNTQRKILGETQDVKGLKNGIKKRLYLDRDT
jgi:hypothetical protein